MVIKVKLQIIFVYFAKLQDWSINKPFLIHKNNDDNREQ